MWSFRGDVKMFVRTITGRMEPELRRAAELYPESAERHAPEYVPRRDVRPVAQA